MDPPYVHHSRYVPFSPPPPPPPPPLAKNPNFYRPHTPQHHHHHSHQLAPPPQQQQLQLQQQQQLLRPPPPPLSQSFQPTVAPPPQQQTYNPQFVFKPNVNNPIEDNRHHHHHHANPRSHHNNHHQIQNFPLSPRVYDHRPHHNRATDFVDTVFRELPPNLWDSSSRHELEANSRFNREDYNDQFQRKELLWQRGVGNENYHRREYFGSDSARSSRDNGTTSNHGSFSRIFDSISGNFDNRYGSGELIRSNGREVVSENQKWSHNRVTSRDARDSLDEIVNNGVGRHGSIKHEYYGSELGRYGNRGSGREGSHEYNRTPRKQLHKKSAFLRIQMSKPSYRNREDERSHIGKDKEQTLEEGERERSPVELDVSFKSNSLVAKAILTSSSGVVSGSSLTPRNSKIRKVLMSDKEFANSPVSKLDEGSVKLDSGHAVNSVSSCDKGPKQSGDKVTRFGIGNGGNSSSQQCSSGTKVSTRKRKVEGSTKDTVSNQGGCNFSSGHKGMVLFKGGNCGGSTAKGAVLGKAGANAGSSTKVMPKRTVSNKVYGNVGSGQTSSIMVAKKRKIVKKVAKKVINPQSQLSHSQPTTQKHDEFLKADCSIESGKVITCLEEKTPIAGKIPVPAVGLQPCSNETNSKVDATLQTVVPDGVGSNVESGGYFVPKINRKREKSPFLLGSSSLEKTKTDEVFPNQEGFCHNTISNAGKDLNKSLNEASVSAEGSVQDVSKQSCDSGGSVLLKNVVATDSMEVLSSIESNNNSGFLSSEENKIVNTCSFTQSINTSTDNDLINLHEPFTVSDIGTVNAGCKQPCTNQSSFSVENDSAGEFLNSFPPMEISEILTSSSLEEAKNHIRSMNADCSNHGRDIMLSSNDICANLEGIYPRACDDIDRCPNNTVSVGGSGKDKPDIKSKRKTGSSHLDLSSFMVTGMSVGPENVVSSAHSVDTTLSLSFKECSEVRDSSVKNFYVGLHPCVDGVRIPDGTTSEMKGSVSGDLNVSLNGTSRDNKRRKLATSHSGLYSPTTSMIKEEPAIADISTSGEEFLTDSVDTLVQLEEVTMSSIDTQCTAGLLPCPEKISAMHENSSAGGSVDAVGSGRDVGMDDGQKTGLPVADSYSVLAEVAIPNALSLGLSALAGRQTAKATTLVPANNHQSDVAGMDSGNGDEVDEDAGDKKLKIPSKNSKSIIFSEHQPSLISEGQPCTNNSCPLEKDCLPLVSSYVPLSADRDGVLTFNTNDEQKKLTPDSLSDLGSFETLSASVSNTLNRKASLNQISQEKNDKIPDQNNVIEDDSNLSTLTSDLQTRKINLKSDNTTESDHSVSKKAAPLASQESKMTMHTLNNITGEMNGRNNQLSRIVPKVYPSPSSFVFSATKNTVSSSSTRNARTWHRTDNSAASSLPGNQAISSTCQAPRPLPKKAVKIPNTSYIRKGNCLVRKPAPVASPSQGSHTLSSSVYRLNSSGVDEVKKSTASGADVTEQPTLLGTGVVTSLERPRTPPLTGTSKVPDCLNSSGNCATSPVAEPRLSGFCEIASDLTKVSGTDGVQNCDDVLKILETPENRTGSGSYLAMETSSEPNRGNLPSLNMKITYVKRKSNQLIATANPCVPSVHNANKNSSDSYYVRSKNQLIRTPLESHARQTLPAAGDDSNSEWQTAPELIPRQSCAKKRSHKVAMKTRKASKFSLVWTLHGTQVSRDDSYPVHQQILPHLVPWKRATYWRSLKQNLASMSNRNSLATIRRKLLHLRKRDTIYTRSAHGFSLRKSKVLSVGGSNLKWSKSIERNSKKANEEATLAVVAAQRMKREQDTAGSVVTGTKNRNSSSRERIFRVGSFRYKMDPTRRTLQRISDDESSCSAARPSENHAKKFYVPRRLIIGNDEYVRIGNGNQLVRDPKKRTRVLASEKIRWSLHTARLRLARKRKYCQFFTRFGKCNKDDGKCPYIHDPSKIAVCTKFLNGLCPNPKCKLTHQVIPERMPDCSYFLQGLCTNKNCSYRHVHVNPNASVCEGFLRGYCADGNECRKKHSYVCPIFEATGSCPQGSKCKLHHPKKRIEGKKNKRLRKQKNALGRYFGSMCVNISEPGTAVLEKPSVQDEGSMIFEGRIDDYMPLGVSDEEPGESIDRTSEWIRFCDSDPSDGLNELIKPSGIMHNLTSLS